MAPSAAAGRATIAGRIAHGIAGRPVRSFAWVVVLLLLAGPFLGRVRFDSSVERLMVAGDPGRALLAEATARFGSDDVLVIAQIGEGPVVEAARLARLDALGEALRALPEVERVWSVTTAGHVRGTPDAVEIQDLSKALPEAPGALAELRADVERSPLYRRHLLSDDGRTAAVVVFPERNEADPFLRDRLVAGVRAVVGRYPGPERLVLSGNPSVTVDIAATMQQEQDRFGVLTVGVLAAVLAWVFRSAIAVFLPLLASGIAVAWVLAGMAALGRSISVLSSIVPSLVLAVGTSYAMHLLHRYGEAQGNPRERAAAALEGLAVPIALSAATTVAGFSALAANRISAISEFGAISAAAVAATALCVMTVLPAGFAALGPALPAAGRLPGRRLLAALENLTLRHPNAILVVATLVLAAAAAGATRLSVDTSYVDFLREEHPANRDRRAVLEHLAGPIPLLVVLDAGREEGALEPDVLRRVARFQRQAEAVPHVHTSFSLADLLAEMNRAWHMDEGSPERFRTVPDTAPLAAQFLLMYESSDFSEDLQRVVDPERRRLAVWLRTELYASQEADQTVAALESLLAEHLGDLDPQITGTLHLLFRSSDAIATGQVRSLAVALVAIGVMMIAVLRSVRLGLLAAVPNLLPVAAMFGVMGWTGVPLNVGTCVVACLVLGVATDDTIHFTLHYREARARLPDSGSALRETHERVGPPILHTSLALFAAFAVLTASAFRPVADLGWLTALTMVTCILGDLLLLPVLLRRFAGS